MTRMAIVLGIRTSTLARKRSVLERSSWSSSKIMHLGIGFKKDKEEVETRQERREYKLRKKREKMPQYGKNLGQIYKASTLKKFKKHD